jgi:hypothetical protein
MCSLGKIGIKLDEETLEYFRMPTEGIVKGSPNSRHYTTRLLPHRDKLRSLINDITIPDSLQSDTSLPMNGPLLSELAMRSKMIEPYFDHENIGENNKPSKLMKKMLKSNENNYDAMIDYDDSNNDNDSTVIDTRYSLTYLPIYLLTYLLTHCSTDDMLKNIFSSNKKSNYDEYDNSIQEAFLNQVKPKKSSSKWTPTSRYVYSQTLVIVTLPHTSHSYPRTSTYSLIHNLVRIKPK